VLASDLLAGTLYQVTGVRLVADLLMILLLLLQMSSSQAEVLQTVETWQVLSDLCLQGQVSAHVVLDCAQDCCQIRLACHCHCRCCSHSPHMSRYQTLPHSLQHFLALLPGSNAAVGRANTDLANKWVSARRLCGWSCHMCCAVYKGLSAPACTTVQTAVKRCHTDKNS